MVKLAGVTDAVIKRANEVLKQIERGGCRSAGRRCNLQRFMGGLYEMTRSKYLFDYT